MVEGKPVHFLIDTGVTFSVLTSPLGSLKKEKVVVQRATGTETCQWTMNRHIDLGKGTVTRSFLVMPDCPYSLLGRDLLSKLSASVSFRTGGGGVFQFSYPNDASHILLLSPLHRLVSHGPSE